ncbi:TetR/AcrR family transcriptional regulator [Streptomyces sp. TS71-3]|uniref:TetR/AcrR family transcriptional regulator n=1 Tax=Streptomyces sp. TS71-3 TaxID=2733862 RepID=UPI001B2CF0D5|nr:TetR/AcrR family transcriptional regulator [Streptomyces sp. TS71-3]GHJ36916.1 TetR family transcriptional regulator [Streptomyces sp. TS71-3]
MASRIFQERGYEKTSLREIADGVGLTKASLYYHFKTKEDILVSLLEGVGRELDELIAWGRQAPRTLGTGRELLTRYSAIFGEAGPVFSILQQNQATMSELAIGREFSDRTEALSLLLRDADAPLSEQIRCVSALLTLHFGTFALQHLEGEPEEKRRHLLDAAVELLSSAYAGRPEREGTA